MRFINYHLGLGDAIICAGLVNFLSRKEEVIIPCYNKNLLSVRAIHSGNEKVKVVEVSYGENVGKLASRFDSITLNGNNFPKGFYEQAGVDWKERWDSCPVWDASEVDDLYYISDVVFIHDDAERGFNIPLTGSRPCYEPSILDYLLLLRGAREIHCIDSSFLHLVECIPPDKFLNNPKFFYHKSARPDSTDYTGCLKHNWQVV